MAIYWVGFPKGKRVTNKMQYLDITETYNKCLEKLPNKVLLDQYMLQLPQFIDYQSYIVHDINNLQELMDVVKERYCEKSVLQVIK